MITTNNGVDKTMFGGIQDMLGYTKHNFLSLKYVLIPGPWKQIEYEDIKTPATIVVNCAVL